MNTTRLTRAALALILAAGSGAVMAQAAADGDHAAKRAADLQKRFAAADANGDGKLTKDEAKGKMPMVYKHFDEIDTAHGGAVTLDDITAYARAHRAERKAAPAS